MRGRHLGHRAECKSGTSGLGQHFKEHHGGSTDSLLLIVIDSVAPGNHKALDEKEAKWIHQLKTMDNMGFGGMNLREDLLRGTRKSCTCGYCGWNMGQKGPNKFFSSNFSFFVFFPILSMHVINAITKQCKIGTLKAINNQFTKKIKLCVINVIKKKQKNEIWKFILKSSWSLNVINVNTKQHKMIILNYTFHMSQIFNI